ncbi:alpha/beta fold hydrolase [Bradyrhizobium sp. WSM 1738]|uniref:alpha/beta fold hydrolase n=1 Tax=Bradyrhizobium hereditatis TaxID=2821405 RepID=UPI001CE3A2E4|nr:alpha/beta fold hydrolase [Bradyrhizobium hereditatis]MCA6113977.1 alpha/beta fold hydrolase [Bradyrhizobium hereditatis]
MDIANWLRRLGLHQYESVFRDNDVDAETLPSLTADDLRELGITSVGHRKKLLSAIAALSPTPGKTPEDDRGLPPAEASASRSSTKARPAERRHLTVMFVDLVGSTALAVRLDPEDMREILATYHRTVAAEVARFGGYIARLMGDGVLVYFGWPQAYEDAAERAVRAGLAIVEAVESLQERVSGALAVRVGIATGLVVVGEFVVEGATQEEDVVGMTPNLAARLEQLAEPGAVVISESTRRLLGGWFTIIDLGPQQLKGIEVPVQAFRVVGEATAEGRFEALRRSNIGPLIGRDNELALLLDRWEMAKGGEGQVVLLSGEAGIGKSRIVLALRERLRNEPRFRIGYYCSPHHVNSALWPVIAQLQRAAGHLHEDTPSLKLEKLERLLGQAGQFGEDAAPRLAEVMGLSLDGYTAPAGTPQEKKARLFGILLAQMEGLSRQRPMLMVLEDAHWLDPTSEELFERVVDRIRGLPILLVATLRPDVPMPWTNFPHVTLLSLNRLGRPACRTLIQMAAGERSLPPIVIEAILSRTEGVPLFVEELTKAVLEAAIWKTPGGDGDLELAGPLPPLAIPATLQDSLMARLDRLAPAREVAQIAACIGREFEEDVVAAIAGYPQPQLAAALGQLCQAGLIQRRGTLPSHAYSFKHALVRDAAYATLLKSSRQQLHARIAQAIEQLRPEIAASQPEIVAHHFIEGGLPDQGAIYLLAAGRLAKARHAAREAVSQLETCLQLTARHRDDAAPIDRHTERECLLMLGDLAGVDDDLDRANNYYERAMALGETDADRDRARNCIHRARHTVRDGARLVFYEHGSGEPAIVFVNPIVYGLATFEPILEQLCQEFRVITVDCRGAGRSAPFVRPYGILQHMEDLRVIIQAADAAPIVGVGISRGSNLLIQLAHKHPELVGKIMTVGTPLIGANGRPLLNPEYMALRDEMALREDAHSRGAIEELIRMHNRYVYSEPESDELRRLAFERVSRLPNETILSFFDLDPDLDVVPLLESIAVPTLVAHGREDQLISYTASEFIAPRIPGAELYMFEGKGHNPMFSATDEFCEVLRNFIRTGRAERTSRGSLAA